MQSKPNHKSILDMSAGKPVLLTNARTVANGDSLRPLQVLIDDQRIASITYDSVALPEQTEAMVLDLDGALVTPGLVDLHIHLREPGETHKETIATGTRAAARGGWTTVCAMPNTIPDPHNPDLLRDLRQLIAANAAITVHPFSPITRGLVTEDLVDFEAQATAGAVAFSNDGKGVQRAGVMLAAMRGAAAVGLPIAAHAEDESIKGSGVINAGNTATRLDLPGIDRLAETTQVARDVLLAQATGAHYHLCHASAAESIRIIRQAQADGVNVSAEASPHHLLLSDADIPADDANWKMNPPLRSELDIEAIIEALNDGTIKAIATDNAPHSMTEKNCSFIDGAFGIVTNEYSFALLYTRLVKTGKISLSTLVTALTSGPAELYQLQAGCLKVGARADLAAFDLRNQTVIDSDNFVGMAHNTPFTNSVVFGDCVMTMHAGQIVHTKSPSSETYSA